MSRIVMNRTPVLDLASRELITWTTPRKAVSEPEPVQATLNFEQVNDESREEVYAGTPALVRPFRVRGELKWHQPGNKAA